MPMAALRELFEAAKAESVQTYIQSGNVVFSAGSARTAQAVAEAVRAGLVDTLGVDSPLIVRSAKRLRAIASEHPLAEEGDSERLLGVAFALTTPKAGSIHKLDPRRSPPDSFLARGSEIYLRYPTGSGRSKLTGAYLDRTLDTVCTVRNWRTISKLVELL